MYTYSLKRKKKKRKIMCVCAQANRGITWNNLEVRNRNRGSVVTTVNIDYQVVTGISPFVQPHDNI